MSSESVEFGGPGDGHAVATWGQQAFWDGLRRYNVHSWYRNVAPVWPVPPGVSVKDLLDMLGATVSRYGGLRTTLEPDADGLSQRVHPRGCFPVELVEAGDELEDATVEVAARLRALDLGSPQRLPFAAAVLTRGGRPERLVCALSNLAVDASSVRILARHLFADGPAAAPARAPWEQSAQERHPRYRTMSARAVEAWCAQYSDRKPPLAERLPPQPQDTGTFPVPAPGRQAVLSSAVAATRAEQLAATIGSHPSTVLLAVVAAAAATVTSRQDLPLQITTSNRHLPGTEEYVGVLSQFSPLTIEFEGGEPFSAWTRRLHQRALRAYRKALWAPAELEAALGLHGRTAEEVLGATFTFNDVRGSWPSMPAAAPEPGQEYALRRLQWWPYQGGRCALAVAGDAATLHFAVRGDSRYVTGGTVLDLLHTAHALLRLAHRDPQAPLAVLMSSTPPRRDGLQLDDLRTSALGY